MCPIKHRETNREIALSFFYGIFQSAALRSINLNLNPFSLHFSGTEKTVTAIVALFTFSPGCMSSTRRPVVGPISSYAIRAGFDPHRVHTVVTVFRNGGVFSLYARLSPIKVLQGDILSSVLSYWLAARRYPKPDI